MWQGLIGQTGWGYAATAAVPLALTMASLVMWHIVRIERIAPSQPLSNFITTGALVICLPLLYVPRLMLGNPVMEAPPALLTVAYTALSLLALITMVVCGVSVAPEGPDGGGDEDAPEPEPGPDDPHAWERFDELRKGWERVCS